MYNYECLKYILLVCMDQEMHFCRETIEYINPWTSVHFGTTIFEADIIGLLCATKIKQWLIGSYNNNLTFLTLINPCCFYKL